MDWVDLLTFILRSFVQYPDAVQVSAVTNKGQPYLTIHVDDRDCGQVIGRGGRNLQAIEKILFFDCSHDQLPRIELKRNEIDR